MLLDCGVHLSRGGLVALAGGAAIVMLWSLADKITARRLAGVGALAVVGAVGVMIAYRTIQRPFQRHLQCRQRHDARPPERSLAQMLKDCPLGHGWNNYAVLINPPYHYGDVVDNYFKKVGEFGGVDKHKGIVESHYYLPPRRNRLPGTRRLLAFHRLFSLAQPAGRLLLSRAVPWRRPASALRSAASATTPKACSNAS